MSDAAGNDSAIRKGATTAEDVLAQPLYADPLRRWDCAPVSDGAAAMIITMMVLTATFVIEILYGFIDPRIKAAQAD